MWVLKFSCLAQVLTVPVTQERLVIGSGEEAEVRLRVPGVSRRHCEIQHSRKDGGGLFVRDLDSRTRTKRRGEVLTEAELSEGDLLTLGPVTLMVLKEPALDWMGTETGGKPSGAPYELTLDQPIGEDTQVPSAESLVMPVLETCVRALVERQDWGRLWTKALGLSDLEIVCAGPAGVRSLVQIGETNGTKTSLELAGNQGQWKARWSGGAPETPAFLRMLLMFTDLFGPGGTQPCKEEPQPSRPVRRLAPLGLEPVWDLVECLVKTDLPLLLSGETGSGKEVLAKEIHEAGLSSKGPFVVVHCAAIPDALFESELFGVESSTASGVDGRKGRLEAANGGTLLLDEVGEIPLPMQAKLLRVLEDSTVVPVGGCLERRLEIRWLSASNRDLEASVKQGRFREDLFYRLRGAEIVLPPLRERLGWFSAFVQLFLGELEITNHRGVEGISVEAARALMAYPWPGNIREFKMEIKRAYFLADTKGLIQLRHLSPHITEKEKREEEERVFLDRRRCGIQKEAIRAALLESGGVVSTAAERLGITRQTLAKRLKELSIDPGKFR